MYYQDFVLFICGKASAHLLVSGSLESKMDHPCYLKKAIQEYLFWVRQKGGIRYEG
jgi:hypothetical protein